MSRLLARVMLAMLMLPLGAVVYLAVTASLFGARLYRGNDDYMVFVIADIAAAAFVWMYWWLLWRSAVRWTAARTGWTLGAVPLWVAAVVPIAAPFERLVGDGFGVFLGGTTAILGWLVTTIFLWRESPSERRARLDLTGVRTIACPTCGYNLTGMKGTICPECGSQFTIDQLILEQPANIAGDLERADV